MKLWLINKKNQLIILVLSIQVAWGYGFFYYLINNAFNKNLYERVNFIVFYSAGYIFKFFSSHRIYDLDLQKIVQEYFFPLIKFQRFYPFNHPPLLAPLLGWVVIENINISLFRWIFILIIFHLITLVVLLNLLKLLKLGKIYKVMIGISILFFSPVFVSLIRGQDSTFLLLSISIFVTGVIFSQEKVAGLGLALAMIRPQLALALALPFIFNRRKIWWWFVFWGVLLFIYTYLLLGLKGFDEFINSLIYSGQGLGFNVDRMATFMGFLLRSFPAINPQTLHILGYSGYLLSVMFTCTMWMKAQAIEFKQLGISILLTMVFVPHLHSHDYSLFLIPILGLVSLLRTRYALPQEYCALIFMGSSLILSSYEIFLYTPIIYFLVLVLILGFLPDLYLRFLPKKRINDPGACD